MNNKITEFQLGDFITYPYSKDSFAIYEGKEINDITPRFSIVAYYSPSKYMNTENGWESVEFFEHATTTKPCNTNITTQYETTWLRKCTEEEKIKALDILKEKYNVTWNQDTLTLINTNSNEILYQIKKPKINYDGNIIKPINNKLKQLLHQTFINNKNKTQSYNTPTYNQYNYYDDYYDSYYD